MRILASICIVYFIILKALRRILVDEGLVFIVLSFQENKT